MCWCVSAWVCKRVREPVRQRARERQRRITFDLRKLKKKKKMEFWNSWVEDGGGVPVRGKDCQK